MVGTGVMAEALLGKIRNTNNKQTKYIVFFLIVDNEYLFFR